MLVLLFILGLIIGSFLSMLSYRLPRNLNFLSDRSRCPNCKHVIAWYDNVPLISFVILQGKCRNCGKKISLRYPLIELATGIVFAILGLNIVNLTLASILIAIFISDLETQIIPDELVFSGLLILNFKFLILNSPMAENLLAGCISACILLLLNLATHGHGMGLGDVKLAVLLGSLTGLNLFLPWLFFSFLSGAIVGIVLLLAKRTNFKDKIPFGPFLIIGFVLVEFFGNSFIKSFY